MKGTSHFHSLTSEDNLALKNARKINKIVSEVGELVDMTATTTTDTPSSLWSLVMY